MATTKLHFTLTSLQIIKQTGHWGVERFGLQTLNREKLFLMEQQVFLLQVDKIHVLDANETRYMYVIHIRTQKEKKCRKGL